MASHYSTFCSVHLLRDCWVHLLSPPTIWISPEGFGDRAKASQSQHVLVRKNLKQFCLVDNVLDTTCQTQPKIYIIVEFINDRFYVEFCVICDLLMKLQGRISHFFLRFPHRGVTSNLSTYLCKISSEMTFCQQNEWMLYYKIMTYLQKKWTRYKDA